MLRIDAKETIALSRRPKKAQAELGPVNWAIGFEHKGVG